MLPPEPRPAGPAEPPAPREPAAALRALLVATGGAGRSWPRCVLPFGALATLAGAAATAITFSLRGPRLDLAQGAALAALAAGLGLLAAAFLCWRARRRRRRRRRAGDARGAAGAGDARGAAGAADAPPPP
ncbi:transmembrane protein 100-like [Dipodomys spectabilis]|uniref:transmembrane protein 100-like n=1 Tax=Dipodomys spectabilis TaxID=105255 RepID=UPI001C5396FE|nr:transmembrane protein 100-like [Dipodomys spectabilis]